MFQMRVTGGFMLISNIYRGSIFGMRWEGTSSRGSRSWPIFFILSLTATLLLSTPPHWSTAMGCSPRTGSCSMLTTVSPRLLVCQRQTGVHPHPAFSSHNTVCHPSTSLRNIDQACPTFIDTINYLAVCRPSSQDDHPLTCRKQPSVLLP